MFTPVLNLHMRSAYGHCWRQDAEPDGHSAALIYLSAIVKVLSRCFNPWYLRPWCFFLTWSVFQVPNLVLIFPDFFQTILLVVSGELIQWVLMWLQQDFWNKNSEGIQGLFSTPRSIIVKMTASSFVSICYFCGSKFPNMLKRTMDFLYCLLFIYCFATHP